MPIFLDTSNLDEIEKYRRMGILRGVTTNQLFYLKMDKRTINDEPWNDER